MLGGCGRGGGAAGGLSTTGALPRGKPHGRWNLRCAPQRADPAGSCGQGQHNPLHEAKALRAELAGLTLGALKQRARGVLEPSDYLEFLHELEHSDDPAATARELIVEGHAWL